MNEEDKYSIRIQMRDSFGNKVYETKSGEDNYEFLRNKIDEFTKENNDIDGGWD